MTDSIRILLCEDQTLMRQGLHTILELEPGFQVVGEAADGEEAVSQYNTLRNLGNAPTHGYSNAAYERCASYCCAHH